MSSDWNHVICLPCWEKREPNRLPIAITNPHVERCCFCGKLTDSGIYVRESPLKVKRYCRGHDGE
jgi:hypothetical protein